MFKEQVNKALQGVGLLNDKNITAVYSHTDGWTIIKILNDLNSTVLFNGEAAQANFMKLVSLLEHEVVYIRSILKDVKDAGLLNGALAQDNFTSLVTLKLDGDMQKHLSYIFDGLKAKGLLEGESAQANFMAVIRPENLQTLCRVYSEDTSKTAIQEMHQELFKLGIQLNGSFLSADRGDAAESVQGGIFSRVSAVFSELMKESPAACAKRHAGMRRQTEEEWDNNL